MHFYPYSIITTCICTFARISASCFNDTIPFRSNNSYFTHCPPLLYIKHFFNRIVFIIYLYLHENICCGYSLEAPRWGASNEYPQLMYFLRNKNIFIGFLLLFGALTASSTGIQSVLGLKVIFDSMAVAFYHYFFHAISVHCNDDVIRKKLNMKYATFLLSFVSAICKWTTISIVTWTIGHSTYCVQVTCHLIGFWLGAYQAYNLVL